MCPSCAASKRRTGLIFEHGSDGTGRAPCRIGQCLGLERESIPGVRPTNDPRFSLRLGRIGRDPPRQHTCALVSFPSGRNRDVQAGPDIHTTTRSASGAPRHRQLSAFPFWHPCQSELKIAARSLNTARLVPAGRVEKTSQRNAGKAPLFTKKSGGVGNPPTRSDELSTMDRTQKRQ